MTFICHPKKPSPSDASHAPRLDDPGRVVSQFQIDRRGDAAALCQALRAAGRHAFCVQSVVPRTCLGSERTRRYHRRRRRLEWLKAKPCERFVLTTACKSLDVAGAIYWDVRTARGF